MEWWSVMAQQTVARTVCAVAGVCWCVPSGAAVSTNPLPAVAQDAQDAADLADASSDSPVLRALSAFSIKTLADKTAAPDAPSDTAQKSASPAPTSKPIPISLGESVHGAAKDLAVSTGVVDAKQYVSEELGLDTTPDANADGINVLRRRASGDTASANNAPPRSAEQLNLDAEQASFLASALVQEVTPWAIGAAVLLGCVQGLRVMLAFSRRQTLRKRKHRKSSRGSATRNARL